MTSKKSALDTKSDTTAVSSEASPHLPKYVVFDGQVVEAAWLTPEQLAQTLAEQRHSDEIAAGLAELTRLGRQRPRQAQAPVELAATGVVSIKELERFLGLSRSTILRLTQRDAMFPKPVNLSPRRTAWRVEDIRTWMDAKQDSGKSPSSPLRNI